MEWLNYHHLYYFSVIAREGGLTAAARKLRLTHSTLSAQLRALEATAFTTMSVNQFALALLGEDSEYCSWLYLVRLSAFVLILAAVIDKNRR